MDPTPDRPQRDSDDGGGPRPGLPEHPSADNGRPWRLTWLADFAILLAAVLVAAFCLFTWFGVGLAGNMTASGALVICLLTFAAAIYLWKERGRMWWVRIIISGTLLARGVSLTLAIAVSDLNGALLLGAGTVLALGVTLGMFSQMGARQIAVAFLVPIEFLATATWVRAQVPGSSLASAIQIGALSLGLPFLIPLGLFWWRRLIADEARLVPGQELEASFWATWLSIIVVSLAALTASLDLVTPSEPSAPSISALHIEYLSVLLELRP